MEVSGDLQPNNARRPLQFKRQRANVFDILLILLILSRETPYRVPVG